MSKVIVPIEQLTDDELQTIILDLERRGCSEHAAELKLYRERRVKGTD